MRIDQASVTRRIRLVLSGCLLLAHYGLLRGQIGGSRLTYATKYRLPYEVQQKRVGNAKRAGGGGHLSGEEKTRKRTESLCFQRVKRHRPVSKATFRDRFVGQLRHVGVAPIAGYFLEQRPNDVRIALDKLGNIAVAVEQHARNVVARIIAATLVKQLLQILVG